MAAEGNAFLTKEEPPTSEATADTPTIGSRTPGKILNQKQNRNLETTSAVEAAARPRRPSPTADNFSAQAPVAAMEPPTTKRVRVEDSLHQESDNTMDDGTCEDHHASAATGDRRSKTKSPSTGTACTTVDPFKPLTDFDRRAKYGKSYQAFSNATAAKPRSGRSRGFQSNNKSANRRERRRRNRDQEVMARATEHNQRDELV